MNQRDLNQAVAHATGEPLRRISRMGFSPLQNLVDESDPLRIDWDAVDQQRRIAMLPARRRRRRVF